MGYCKTPFVEFSRKPLSKGLDRKGFPRARFTGKPFTHRKPFESLFVTFFLCSVGADSRGAAGKCPGTCDTTRKPLAFSYNKIHCYT